MMNNTGVTIDLFYHPPNMTEYFPADLMTGTHLQGETKGHVPATMTSSFNFLDAVTSDRSNITMNTSVSSVFDRYTWTQFLLIFCPIALNVDRLVTPVWYFIGICGNIISARLWTTRKMRRNNSSAVYLSALAISDTSFLLLHVMQELQYAWDVKTLDYPVLCETYFVLYLSAQYLSPLLVLGFTTERWIAVCRPFQKERFCTEGRAVRITVSLVASSLMLCVIQSYFWTYDGKQCRQRHDSAIDGADGTIFWTVWTWVTELIVFFAVPLLILVFNVFVIAEIRRLTAARMSLVPKMSETTIPVIGFTADNNTGGEKFRDRKESSVGGTNNMSRRNSSTGNNASTTLMLLYVSFYVILTTLPATLVYAIIHYFPEGSHNLTDVQIMSDSTWRLYFAYLTTRKVVEEICLSHYACNFILYMATGPQFRKAASELFSVHHLFRRDSNNKQYTTITRRSTTCVTSL